MTIPDQADPYDSASRRDDLILAMAYIVENPRFASSHNELMLASAITRAVNGWPVLPLNGKAPAIKKCHPRGHPCKGQCGRDGHGVWDATTDIDRVIRWWDDTPKLAGANVGMRVPDALVVIDLDPRKPAHVRTVNRLMAEHGPFPPTLMTVSGRRDGGRHMFYLRPPGKLNGKPFGEDGGIDVLGTGRQTVAPLSVHPETGWRYTELDAPIVAPGWLANIIVKKPAEPPTVSQKFFAGTTRTYTGGNSVADWYCENHSWADVLMPYGWAMRGNGDPDGDGAVWMHPTATSQCSATVTNGCLFVWSTSTVFEPSSAGDPHGYTKFKAYAVLNHGGETHEHMSAAARSIRTLEGVA